MDAPQWQRWTITLPSGRHRTSDGTTVMNTCDVAFDVYVPNVYSDEAAMRVLVERAGAEAFMEYGDPPRED